MLAILNKLNPIFDAFTANLDIVSGSIGKNTALVSTLKKSLRNLIEMTKDNATIMDIITEFMTQFDSIFKGDGQPLQNMIESKEKLDGLIISLEQEIAGDTETDTADMPVMPCCFWVLVVAKSSLNIYDSLLPEPLRSRSSSNMAPRTVGVTRPISTWATLQLAYRRQRCSFRCIR